MQKIFPYFPRIAVAMSSTYVPAVPNRCSQSLCLVSSALQKSNSSGWDGPSTSQACCPTPAMNCVWFLTITWATLYLTGSPSPQWQNVNSLLLIAHCTTTFHDDYHFYYLAVFLKPLSLRRPSWCRVTSQPCLWIGAALSLSTVLWENIL